MTAQSKLTETQTAILKAAVGRPEGNIEPLPPSLRGGVRTKVIESLLARGFIAESEESHLLTNAGYAAIGKQRPVPKGGQKLDAPDAVAKGDTTMPSRNWRSPRPPSAPAPSWLRSSTQCATPAVRPSPG
ncbi:MAG: hypothetical protein IT531_22075 [Burkholderiales bacterium]|nr:hypothetical protein [Burkholderiales bacterium]